jgi:hypothetical protein
MGEPIRIVELAENMIRLAGMLPYEDIDIQFTGLRPGEKLIEEINTKSEVLSSTDQEKMRVIREQPLSWDVIPTWIERLEELLAVRKEAELIAHIQTLVPEYDPCAELVRERHERVFAGKPAAAHTPLWSRNGNGTGSRERKNGNSQHPARRNGNSTVPPIACEE